MRRGATAAVVVANGVMPLSVPMSPAMLAAGRQAFYRQRSNLSDLWECFDSDLDEMLSDIFSSMARVG